MLMKYGDFQFSYKLWFEDSSGSRLSLPTTSDSEDVGKDSADAAARYGVFYFVCLCSVFVLFQILRNNLFVLCLFVSFVC